MKKILLTLILNSFIFADDFFLDIKDEDGKIKTIMISEDKYNKINENIEFHKYDNKKVVWNFKNDTRDYEIIKTHKTYETIEQKEKKELELEKTKIEEKEIDYSFLKYIIIVAFLFFIYKKFKTKKELLEEIKIEKIKTEIKEEKVIAIEEEIKNDNLDYKELEKIRVKLYKQLKYNKEIDKNEKTEMYNKLSSLKIDILTKRDYKTIENELNKILNKG